MRVYLDSSALLKRVLVESESEALVQDLDSYAAGDALLVSSSLAWVEVSRALRNRLDSGFVAVAEHLEDAMNGIAEHPVEDEILGLSRRLNPNALRSLDALHLASALVLDTDIMLTYDDRLAQACEQNGLPTSAPGRVASS